MKTERYFFVSRANKPREGVEYLSLVILHVDGSFALFCDNMPLESLYEQFQDWLKFQLEHNYRQAAIQISFFGDENRRLLYSLAGDLLAHPYVSLDPSIPLIFSPDEIETEADRFPDERIIPKAKWLRRRYMQWVDAGRPWKIGR